MVIETTKLCLIEQPSLTLFKLLLSGMLFTLRKSLDGMTGKTPLFIWKQIFRVANEEANTRVGLSFLYYKTPDNQRMFNFPPPPRFSRCDFQQQKARRQDEEAAIRETGRPLPLFPFLFWPGRSCLLGLGSCLGQGPAQSEACLLFLGLEFQLIQPGVDSGRLSVASCKPLGLMKKVRAESLSVAAFAASFLLPRHVRRFHSFRFFGSEVASSV